jgi:hypothetical protein
MALQVYGLIILLLYNLTFNYFLSEIQGDDTNVVALCGCTQLKDLLEEQGQHTGRIRCSVSLSMLTN